ncbi:hypothetical protein OCEANICA350_11108 [Oceanicaulis sp. 350]|nr:hypothetical protein OCEANICA350_11108 [Oceanicaulis sp. 350]
MACVAFLIVRGGISDDTILQGDPTERSSVRLGSGVSVSDARMQRSSGADDGAGRAGL